MLNVAQGILVKDILCDVLLYIETLSSPLVPTK